jgi:hypothetical protein
LYLIETKYMLQSKEAKYKLQSKVAAGRKQFKNTTSKLGSHTKTHRGTCPGVGLLIYYKCRYNSGGSEELVLNPFIVDFGPVFARAYVSRGFPG